MQVKNKNVVLAGGGLVENEKGEVLFMFRRGKWDLPKGKLDEGETMENCAVREVMEETGISKPELKKLLLVTEHIYVELGKEILKQTHWYLMKSSSQEILIPQTEEDISILKWAGKTDLPIILNNTYPGIIEVLRAGQLLS